MCGRGATQGFKGNAPPRVERADTGPSEEGCAVFDPVVRLPIGDSGLSTACQLLAEPSTSLDNGVGRVASVVIRLLDFDWDFLD